MYTLTLQAYLPSNQIHQWQDIATLEFDKHKRLMAMTYLNNHCHQHFLADNVFAVSLRYPVDFFSYPAENGWFTFLDDIIPAGASRRYWLKRLDLARHGLAEQNYELLKKATIAPIGHLRIKEAVQTTLTKHNHKPINQKDNQKSNNNLDKQPFEGHRLFSVADVINRDVDFLEYANEQGAMAGGATGAGGEAPKLLLRQRQDNGIWIDHLQDHQPDDHHYLVKYPRGKRSPIDCDILRAEYYFYHELSDMGFNTIDTTDMKLYEGERYPSLWLPRFDVYRDKNDSNDTIKRHAMESVYAMLKKGAGAYLNHDQCIRSLIDIITSSHLLMDKKNFDKQAFVIEWVQRDLLNIAFGNSDNHGRNTAFLRNKQNITLAPIFDFAPMKADPEGIVRTIKWDTDRGLESGGTYRFDLIAEQLSDLVPPNVLLSELTHTANKLLGLPSRLADKGVPTSILTFPTLGYKNLADNLKAWGLL